MEENNDKKTCPFCGAEINKDAKKCRFCGNWIDEEIQCPFCAEKIKASAKKCRFCGEWLEGANDNSLKSDKKQKDKKESKPSFSMPNKNVLIISGAVLAVILLIFFVIGIFTYVPNCKSSTMQRKLKEHLAYKFPDIGEITLDKSSAHKLKRIEKGYSCAVNASIEDTPTSIEYTYKKVALNEFDLDAKFVLPDCYDSSVKSLLSSLIKEYDGYNIKNNTADVQTNLEVQNDYDKEKVSYSCVAEATLTSKPGKAFLINSWNYSDASRKMKCKVDYNTYFCKNGYTTCVGLTDLYSCKYEDD